MIVNLIGPPAAGKSTFAAKFVLEHPYFTYCSIDAYRVEHKDEVAAWNHFINDIWFKQPVVMESSGLHYRLGQLKNWDIPILTIAFDGDPDVFERRLRERQKRPIPYEYRKEDEVQLIYWVLGNLEGSPVQIDKYINASELSTQQIYEELAQTILDFRVKRGERP